MNKKELDSLIDSAIDRVKGKILGYVRTRPPAKRHRDDMLGEARLAIISVARDIELGKKAPDKPDAYLFTAGWNAALGAPGLSTAGIRVPRRTASRRQKEAREVPAIKPSPVETIDDEQNIRGFRQQQRTANLYELALACCETPEEQQVLELRLEGREDQEIAKLLNVSRRTVSRRRERIGIRLSEELSLSV